jgi:hypothetical protein
MWQQLQMHSSNLCTSLITRVHTPWPHGTLSDVLQELQRINNNMQLLCMTALTFGCLPSMSKIIEGGQLGKLLQPDSHMHSVFQHTFSWRSYYTMDLQSLTSQPRVLNREEEK